MKLRQLPVFLLCVLNLPAFAAVSLKAALQQNMVSVKATSSGASYMGKGLHLQVQNKTGKPLQIMVDPALVFLPADPAYQPLIVAGETVVAVAQNGETSIDLQSFCGNIGANAPGKDIAFNYKQQGDSNLIKVMHFVNQNKFYTSAAQHAVWALTNDMSLSGIYDELVPEVSNKLLALMMKLTKRPAPDYFKQYKLDTTASQPILAPRTLKIYSVFEWKLTESKKLTLAIYDSHNEVRQHVFDNKDFIKGGYKLTVEFEAEDVPRDTYFIRLKDGETVMKEQKVVVD